CSRGKGGRRAGRESLIFRAADKGKRGSWMTRNYRCFDGRNSQRQSPLSEDIGAIPIERPPGFYNFNGN
ncbi:hypothetical protein K0M31_003470, partial [Melipona bicolor]